MNMPKLISDREVLQPSGREDVCVGRVQEIELPDGSIRVVRFWYQRGHLHHLDSQPK